MKLVFVLVDALKSLYLTEENMPFLWELAHSGKYVKEVIPCVGFCERSEIFSGLDAFDTGNFTAIGYRPEKSPYRKSHFILNILTLGEKINSYYARKISNIWRRKTKKTLGTYQIPLKSLPYYALTEDGREQLIPHRTIFDSLKDAGKTFTLNGFTSLADTCVRTVLPPEDFVRIETSSEVDFIPVYIGIIDSVGHRFGKDIDSIKPYLKQVDDTLKEIYSESISKGYAFAVLGDHGMVPVERYVNIKEAIETLSLRLHMDYEYFLDSTIARFWFFKEKAREAIYQVLSERFGEDGIIVDETNCKKYRIPLDVKSSLGKPVYGDMMWCANPGVLLSPDFFHTNEVKEKGMHGYVNFLDSNATGLFVASSIVSEEIDKMSSSLVCNELCDMLGVEHPNKNFKRMVI